MGGGVADQLDGFYAIFFVGLRTEDGDASGDNRGRCGCRLFGIIGVVVVEIVFFSSFSFSFTLRFRRGRRRGVDAPVALFLFLLYFGDDVDQTPAVFFHLLFRFVHVLDVANGFQKRLRGDVFHNCRRLCLGLLGRRLFLSFLFSRFHLFTIFPTRALSRAALASFFRRRRRRRRRIAAFRVVRLNRSTTRRRLSLPVAFAHLLQHLFLPHHLLFFLLYVLINHHLTLLHVAKTFRHDVHVFVRVHVPPTNHPGSRRSVRRRDPDARRQRAHHHHKRNDEEVPHVYFRAVMGDAVISSVFRFFLFFIFVEIVVIFVIFFFFGVVVIIVSFVFLLVSL